MNHAHFRLVWVVALLVSWVGSLTAQRASEDTPDYSTLQRLAQQLGGKSGSNQIDPEMIKAIQEYLKNNPQITNDPKFKELVEAEKAKLQQNPDLAEQYKKQFNPQQLQQLKSLIPNVTGGSPNQSGSGLNPQGGPIPPPITPRPPPSLPFPPTGGGAGNNKGGNQNTGSNPVQNLNGGPRNNGSGPNTSGTRNTPPPFTGGTGNTDIAKQLAEQNKEFSQVAGLWEQNFGSLDKTPALKQSLVDMFSGEGGGPFSGMKGSGPNLTGKGGTGSHSSNWNMNGPSNAGGSGFGNWLKNMSNNGGPSWWKNLTSTTSGKSWFGGSSSFSPPSSSGIGGGGIGSVGSIGGSAAGLGTFGLIVLLLIVVSIVGFFVYRYWPQIQAMRTGPKALPGFGPWPIDPREVKDRETLVRVFEYLSVAICGDGARVWNHVTIADAFRENVPGAAPFADQLARLYAVARYTPTREEISPTDIAEARRYLCRLAGVSDG